MLKHQLARPASLLQPRLLERFMRPWNEWLNEEEWPFNGRMTVPDVNITEDEKSYNLNLAAPGLKRDDFKIDLEGDLLTIRSEKEESKEEKARHYTRKEYGYHAFSRSFTLPDDVNRERIDAHYEDGILKVSLARKEEMIRKKMLREIPVK